MLGMEVRSLCVFCAGNCEFSRPPISHRHPSPLYLPHFSYQTFFLYTTVVSCEFDRKDIEMNKLVVTMLESKYRLFDLRTQHAVEGFAHLTEKCHKSTVWLAKHLPQNRDVWLTSGGNGGMNLYRYNYPTNRTERDPEGRLRGKMGSAQLLNARIMSTQPIVGVSSV